MEDYLNRAVKIFIPPSTKVEGIVQEWNNENVKLLSTDGVITVIFNPKQNIQIIQILPQVIPIQNIITQKKPLQEISKVQEEFKTEAAGIPSDDLKPKKLSELQNLLKLQEKEIISNKMKEHQPNGLPKTNYELPRFYKK